MQDLYAGFDFLGRLMDVSTLRARVTAHNVANLNTPGYRRKEVLFEESLRRALSQEEPGATPVLPAQVVEDRGGTIKPNGNNVVLEDELAFNAKNHLYFQVVSEVLRWRFGLYRDALQER